MKKLFSAIAMGCLLSLLLVGSVHAQLPGAEIRASIPFDFTVRGKTLPAGEYSIKRIGDEPTTLLMQSMRGKHENVMFHTAPLDKRRLPRRDVLVFTRCAGSYFREQVVPAGEETAREE